MFLDRSRYKVPTFEPSIDSLGAMVCIADAHDKSLNASTCACQSWDWTLHNSSNGTAETIWFCETAGAGAEMWRPADVEYTSNRGRSWRNHRSERYLPTPNMFHRQWAPAPMQQAKSASGSGIMAV